MKNPNIVIELKNVSKDYGKGDLLVNALKNVNLHIEQGEIVMIMGPSGSGKTTLLQLIGALLKPTSGDILIEKQNLNELSNKKLSKLRLNTFGFIYQTHNLLSALNALKNIEVILNLAGKKGKKAKALATKLLSDVNLDHRLHHKPSKLSGGEQQRVAIARALANNPSIILADEPTASLDSKTGYQIVEILRKIAKEHHTTVVVVTHDTRIKNLADRILWLEDGKLKVEWASSGVAIDPVCLMVIDPQTAEFSLEYQGKTYYFCMEECRKKFDKNPQQFDFGIT
ncbi:MAG: ATP-binding cassette domain-containing protein [Promethearchaeota archaeon]